MAVTRGLLVVMAVLEAATGVALLVLPVIVVSLLLGASLDSAGGLAVARIAGAALLSLGLTCWFARHVGQTGLGRGVVVAMLVYNIVVIAVLAHAGLGLGMGSIGLWPAAGAHVVLASCCLASLRSRN